MSFASDPEPVKKTWLKRGPACDVTFSASSVVGVRRGAEEGVVIGQLVHLPHDGIGDLLAAIADIDAPEPGKTVQILLALAVPDVDALAALDDARAVGIQLLHVGEGMQMVGGIDGGEI